MKVTTFEVAKGTNVNGRQVSYRLVIDTSDLDPKDMPGVRLGAESMIDGWLAEFAPSHPVQMPQPATMPQAPNGKTDFPDIADIEALPWKARDKSPAAKGAWGWMLSDPRKNPENCFETVRKLMAGLEQNPKGIDIGEYVLVLKGDKKQFINREPKKQESAR
jgi:hypothetical protein